MIFFGYGQIGQGPFNGHNAGDVAPQPQADGQWPQGENHEVGNPDAAPAAQDHGGNAQEQNIHMDVEDFIPVPELNAQEEEDLAVFNAMADPGFQMAQALNAQDDLQMLQQMQGNVPDSFTISGSISSSESSVNMEQPQLNLDVDNDVILGLEGADPPQQPLPNDNFLVEGAPFPNQEIVEGPVQDLGGNMQVNFMRHVNLFYNDSEYIALLNRTFGKKPVPDTYRLKAKFFDGTLPVSSKVSIPLEWADFFTNLLLSPTHFDWAKKFLSSKAWELITPSLTHPTSLQFNLPIKCPSFKLQCNTQEVRNVDNDNETGTENLSGKVLPEDRHVSPARFDTHKKITDKEKAGIVIVEDASVRRSLRIKNNSKGFKKKGCPEKNCLSCAAEPPTISRSVIKNLGSTFCNMKPNDISDDMLLSKKGTSKKPIKKTSKKDEAPATALKPKAKRSTKSEENKENDDDTTQ